MNQLATDITAVMNLIKNPAAWTQESSAKDIFGHAVSTASQKAVCWCIMGAITTVVNRDAPQVPLTSQAWCRRKATMVSAIVDQINPKRKKKGPSVPSWNDAVRRTHDDVMKMLAAVQLEAVTE